MVAALPEEDFIYLGDVARLPYGTKSPRVVSRYAQRCLEFLLAQGAGVKMVVIACNTATANALPELQRGSAVEVMGVIEPGVRAAVLATRMKRVLVLATASTVRSEAYPKEFARLDPTICVQQLACPLLVPLAEEGWFEHPLTVSVIREYLRTTAYEFDTVVLGCTHYPLLEPAIREVMGEQTAIVHGANLLARDMRAKLIEASLLNSASQVAKQRNQIRFLSTDVIPSGLPLVRSLFGDHTSFELVDIKG